MGRSRKIWLFRLTAVGMAVLVAGLMSETALRLMGFEYQLFPTEIQFGWPNPEVLKKQYTPDPDLLWVTRDYTDKLDRWRNRHPDIAFMGCSCTEFSKYGEFFAEEVAAQTSVTPSWVNLGVGGWSSYQGLQQLKRDVIPLSPGIVTIYYGWNDHWKNFGAEDKAVGAHNRRHPLLLKLTNIRLVQLANYVKLNLLDRTPESVHPVRVPLGDFRSNLVEMVTVAREHGITPVLMTAPASHIPGQEPPNLAKRWLDDLSMLVPLHRQYAAVVREVADDHDVVLVDLAAEFDALLNGQIDLKYFRLDGIHPTPDGSRKIAEIMVRRFREEGLLVRMK